MDIQCKCTGEDPVGRCIRSATAEDGLCDGCSGRTTGFTCAEKYPDFDFTYGPVKVRA